MITVSILINGYPIFTRSAVRREMKDEIGTYELDDGTFISHKYDNGAVPLAKAMLDTIKEQKP